MKSQDRIVGGALLLLGLLGIYLTMTTVRLRHVAGDTGPRLFPYIASIGVTFCGLMIFWRNIDKEIKPLFAKDGLKRVLLAWVVLISFVSILRWVGFVVASTLLVFCMSVIFDKEKKVTLPKKILFTIMVVLCVYSTFTYLLAVRLPRGVLHQLF